MIRDIHQALMNALRPLLMVRQLLVNARQQLMSIHQSLLDAHQLLTSVRQSLPGIRQSLLNARQSVPSIHQPLLDVHQALTDARQPLPNHQQGLQITHRILITVRRNHAMTTSSYMPNDDAGKADLLDHLAATLPKYAALLGLSDADLATRQADAASFRYTVHTMNDMQLFSCRHAARGDKKIAARWSSNLAFARSQAGVSPPLNYEMTQPASFALANLFRLILCSAACNASRR